MPPIEDHPKRYATVNELHARPFPSLPVPCTAVFLAIKEPVDAASRDRALDRTHLLDLLTREGGQHPAPEATHFFGPFGRGTLKWESHTEFVTYTAFTPGVSARPFDPAEALVFPEDWMAQAPGKRLTSALIRVETMPEDEAEMLRKADEWFVPESLAMSWVVDRGAVVACDFRIDASGQMRLAVFVRPGISGRRVGRIVQRLCEIEIYRAMSMLGLLRAQNLTTLLNQLDPRLTGLVSDLDHREPSPEVALHALLGISAELESMSVKYTFRFGATAAYEAILTQRIEALREERIEGRQTFAEFMMRRYDPAMRTVKSTDKRLHEMAERAQRAAELLRTRVDVERSAQNQKLLESMDRRADLQLRLQRTVEGLSVVAISYYAVSLAAYVATPLGTLAGLSKESMTAALVLPVVLLVWLMVRRVKDHLHDGE
ncbi:DUF3422 domain-containing protein [Rhodobacter sp. Har01]|uniref:DUF3422 family protein n=1 Tax=Rhodobacter sp. Har01 TaxID=2883999 RepID=UPI001D086A62|nr:DUF3422 domain-containing protein [Rhodobacter sp. Har01]MCB6177608.1 DUF3422 domain-containing protein [Rhodobacter sp. Har01]